MTETWLISIPVETHAEDEWEKIVSAVSKVRGCEIYKFYVPHLKISTLDTLLNDFESLGKLEMYLEGLILRLASSLATAFNLENSPKLKELLLVRGHTISHYLLTFKWDSAKFPVKQTIKSINDLALKQGLKIETEYKLAFSNYTAAKAAYESSEKKDAGTLLTRNLREFIKPKDYVSNSIYLATIFIIVPKKLITDWDNMYERFDETVVPKSSRIITEDPDYYLVGITLFQKNIPAFTENCRKFKFIVRPFRPDDNEIERNKQKIQYYKQKKDELFDPLVTLLKHSFCEMYSTYVHIKAARIFVESVLKYGVPPNFISSLIFVGKKHEKKARDVLFHLYKHLDNNPISEGDKVHIESGAAVGHNPADYHPYISTKINTEIL